MHARSLWIVLVVVSVVVLGQSTMLAGKDYQSIDYVIIVTGGELLQGAFPDGHTVFITRMLHPLGFRCVSSFSVDDRKPDIEAALRFAVGQADLVLVTGGLGPTDNDITRDTLSVFTGIPLQENIEVLGQLERFFRAPRERLRSNVRRQARVPVQGTYLKNPRGTAVGLVFEAEQAVFVALPGPPGELEPMVREQLIPYLSRHFGSPMPGCSMTLRFVGLGQSRIVQTLEDHIPLPSDLVQLSQFRGGRVDFIFSFPDNTPRNRARLDELKDKILEHLGDSIYADNARSLEATVLQLLAEDGGEITLAEVGSGGSLAAALSSTEQLREEETHRPVILRAFVGSNGDALWKLLNPLPDSWDPGAAAAENTICLAKAAAARAPSRWVIAVGEVRPGPGSRRYVDVVSQRGDGPLDSQAVPLHDFGTDARDRLTTQLLDYLRRRLRDARSPAG